MANIVIIGAGLTGLSTAYHLEQKGFFDYTIFEKESDIGGLCRSVELDGFTFDFTGHLLHINDPYFNAFIAATIGKETLNTIHRRSYIYSHNTYTKYPFQINLYGLPPAVIAECIEGFVTRKIHSKTPKTFPEWVLQNFGAGFAHHFFSPFQTKIFAHNISKITASWTGRFVPKTSLQQMIIGAVSDYEDPSIGYNSTFFYPKQGGIQTWITSIAQQLKNPIRTNSTVKLVDLINKRIHFTNGHDEPFDQLITTMPLNTFLTNIRERAVTKLQSAAKKLLCNSVINFNLGIARDNVSNKHWIYFPENQYPFYRLGFPHNFAPANVPEGCSSLYGEFAYMNKTQQELDELLAYAITQTKELFALDDQEIITEKVININHAYVIYNFWREKYLSQLLETLAIYDVHSIGRYGGWKYASMQEAVLDGKMIVDRILISPARKSYEVIMPVMQQERIVENG